MCKILKRIAISISLITLIGTMTGCGIAQYGTDSDCNCHNEYVETWPIVEERACALTSGNDGLTYSIRIMHGEQCNVIISVWNGATIVARDVVAIKGSD